jgi:cytochrome c oxidase assembly protein subunit 15
LHEALRALGRRIVSLALYAAIVLVANVLVVLWGAYVRATGSGAGCGDHWPLCNGEVVPRAPEVATMIEFTHRATSGLALLLVVGLIIWTWRTRPAGDRLRFWAALSGLLMVSEALIGAGLVLFRLVAQDTSSARPFVMIAHLLNTFALLAALALSARWAREPAAPHRTDREPRPVLLMVAMALLIATATTGAIAALGNTLFPVSSLAEGLQQDFSPTSHVLLRLRVLHPVLGVGGGVLVALLAAVTAFRSRAPRVLVSAGVVLSLVILQLFCGVATLLLLAPVWLQIVHLLLADALWIAVVLLASLARDPFVVEEPARNAALLALVPRKG